MRKKRFWFTFFCLSTLLSLATQLNGQAYSYNPRFELFTLPGGSLGNSVQSMVQDEAGFLWFGTQDGLMRYDGISFEIYRSDPFDPESLADNYIEWIHPDDKGFLWLAHYGGGVSKFDPVSEKAVRYLKDNSNPNSLSSNQVSVITSDSSGYIWVGTTNGLNRIDPASGSIKRFYHKRRDHSSLSHNNVRALYVDKAGTLWVGTGFPWESTKRGGLCRYEPETESFTVFRHKPGDPTSLRNEVIRALYEDSKGNFWVGTHENGLHKMDRERGTFEYFAPESQVTDRLVAPKLENHWKDPDFKQISFIKEDQNGRLWIGSIFGGLNVYDPDERSLFHFEQSQVQGGALKTDFLWNFFQSRDGIIWLMSGDGGGMVFRVREDRDLFTYENLSNYFDVHPELITAIYPDKDSTVWLGFEKSYTGLVKLNMGTQTSEVYFPVSDEVSRGPIGIYNILKLRDGRLWLTTESKILIFDPKTERFSSPDFQVRYLNGVKQDIVDSYEVSKIYSPPGNDLAVSFAGVSLEAKDGRIWISSLHMGLFCFDPDNKKLLHFLHDPGDPHSIRGNSPRALWEDEFGRIWVGGGPSSGSSENLMFLDRFDPYTGRFEHILEDSYTGGIFQIAQGIDSMIWLATLHSGLKSFHLPSGTSKNYQTENSKIPSNLITSMCISNKGLVWLTTPGNLVQFNPNSESFFTFTDQPDLKIRMDNEKYAVLRGKSEFAIGNGSFYSGLDQRGQTIKEVRKPKIKITELLVQDKKVVPVSRGVRRPIWENPTISIAHDQNIFSLKAAVFDFHDPKSNHLEFKLDNYDEDWRTDLQEGKVTYYNVPPGDYTFLVRGANSEGIWSEDPAQMKILINPPWWSSWWAYVLYAVLFFGFLYGIYRFQLMRKLEQAEAVRLRELDEVKTRLFTNMTHEFRTPLTVISGMSERIKEDPETWFHDGLDMINRNADRLFGLVNRMLDLSKLESGKMQVDLVQGDGIAYLKFLTENLDSYADSQGVQIHFYSEEESLMLDFDPEKWRQIMTNLLSNAIKFTPEGGNVYIHIDRRKLEDAEGVKQIEIRVRDTGIGMREEVLDHIFDRFYQADGSHTRTNDGTGIGLALTHELVRLLDGEIKVKSKPGVGTEFRLFFPIRKQAPYATADLWRHTGGVSATSGPIADNQAPRSGMVFSDQPEQNGLPEILLIEDNPDVTTYVASVLQAHYRVRTAQNGVEGVEMAFAQVPDLVVSDVMMPEKDGFELCHQLKSDERTSHIPVILLTAKADMDSRLEGLEKGADAYLAKPFHEKELLLRITKLLESRRKLQSYFLSLVNGAEAQGATPSAVPHEAKPLDAMEDRFVKRALSIVEEHLEDSEFSVEDFCRALNLSHSQVHRKLSALTGLSANRFIRHVRLSRAKELLKDPEASVLSVAFDTGFSDPNYFGRVFRKEFGVTPTQWREGNMA